MKNNRRNRHSGLALLVSMLAVCALTVGGIALSATHAGSVAAAENAAGEPAAMAPAPTEDNSPALYVAQKNADSVVGILTSREDWSRSTRQTTETMIGEGSGVVIAEGGYILTNYHVIEDGSVYKVLLPNGEKVSATLTGTDSSLDLAVLKVDEQADTLVPVTIGSSGDLKVGATAIAIGNPGGEVLAKTVTQGIISALARTSVNSNNTTRNVEYIQHDAAISSGNSGGGLFDYQGNLIGINTLKYSGSRYTTSTYEGLGFAIPVDTAYPIAMELIEHGKVLRPQMGVTVVDYEGPDEPTNEYPPASVCIYKVGEGTPAEQAGLHAYDFIYAVNDQRVTSLRELTTALDQYKAGDTVKVTVVRYNNAGIYNNSNAYSGYGYPYGGNYPYGFGFGGFGGFGDYYDYFNGYGQNGSDGQLVVGGGYSFVDVDVTLEILDQDN